MALFLSIQKWNRGTGLNELSFHQKLDIILTMKKLLIGGANGFLARHITEYFSEQGWAVSGLARREEGLHDACRYIHWDGQSMGEWSSELDDCDVLINMVGRSINCRHNDENKKQILETRVQSTELLGRAIAASENPPSLWINASGSGIYETVSTEPQNESGAHGDGFIADVAKQWEAALFEADIPASVRRVALRTAMVVADEKGNPYRVLSMLAKFGLGGKVGNGQQMVSWIHIDDVPRVIEHIIKDKALTGPVNMAAPEAVSNAEMMSRFRKSVGMSVGLPAPELAVRLGTFVIGTAPELILDSCSAAPEKLLESGFVFQYEKMSPAEW